MRQKLLCSLVLLLCSPVAFAQQWPNFKEPAPATNWAAAPYGAPGYPPGAPGNAYPGPYYVANPYQPAAANAYFAPPYYPPGYYPPNPNGYRPVGYYPAPPAGAGPVAPASTGPPPMAVAPPPPTAACPPEAVVPPDYFLPPSFADVPHCEKPPPEKTHQHLGWINLDYVASWLKPGHLPGPLLTTGSTADAFPGAVGQPGTIPLFGQNGIEYGMSNGFKGELGVWLDCENHYSLDLGGFVISQGNVNFSAASDPAGNPLLVRPIFDVINNQERGELVSFPGQVVGSTTIRAEADLYGLELNGRWHAYPSPRLQLETLFGFRFINLRESLQISDQLTPLVDNRLTFNGNFLPAGDQLSDFDRFTTSNHFFGFQIGEQFHREFGPFFPSDFSNLPLHFFVGGFAKVGLGLTDETVNINGQTTLIDPTTGTTTAPGGLLALPSNSGNFHRTVFGFVPEVGLTFGFDLTSHFRLQTGYSFLMWNAVVRPGSQIDRNISTFQVPSDQNFGMVAGPPVPGFAFHDEWFFVHNFYFGVECRY